jgi:hypothetical protein
MMGKYVMARRPVVLLIVLLWWGLLSIPIALLLGAALKGMTPAVLTSPPRRPRPQPEPSVLYPRLGHTTVLDLRARA